MGKNVTIGVLVKYCVYQCLPVIIQKMVKSKEHCSPTRSKTVFCFDILLKKGRKKTVATLTQVVPDDQSRNDQKNDQGRLTKKNGIMVFQVNLYI